MRNPGSNPRHRRFMPLLAVGLLAAGLAHAGDPAIPVSVAANGMSSWLIDNVDNPPLTLLRGKTYAFNLQNVSVIHPFYIKTANSIGSTNQYTDGVTNNGASGSATVTFSVPLNAPDSLHYNCGNHASMNGPITIVTDTIFAAGFD